MKKLTFAVFIILLIATETFAQVSVPAQQPASAAHEVSSSVHLVRHKSLQVRASRPVPAVPPVPPSPEMPEPPAKPALRQTEPSDDPVYRKVFSKSFPVDRSNRVVITNQFGEVQIKSWDKMEVRAEVEIKAYASGADEARRLLDGVNIEANKSDGSVTYRTLITDNQGNWGSWFSKGKRTRREVRVNYVVYVPTVNALNISNQYGNVEMGNFSGALNAKVQYGNFNALKLTNSSVLISTQYGKTNVTSLNKATIRHEYGAGVTIGTASSLNLHAQYVKVNIGTVNNDAQIRQEYGDGLVLGSVGSLNLIAQYIKVNIREIKEATAMLRLDYASLQLGSVQNVNLDADYTDVNVSNLRGDGRFNMSYNRLNIGLVGPATRTVLVSGEYAEISLGFSDDFHADFDVATSYSNLRYSGNSRITMKALSDDERTARRYLGRIGRGGGTVKINSSYGGVTFR
ncbi:hypothetical protein C7T94_03360 [Pedobacter yulinensis]|uniref:Adhesin domain-containing protein n=1 Tax=Pedobacter yulinensis TaxID=2126353 RepID=A0A2T3HRX0_9SPHI|nr:hypothetical protein [Pedobacter yulinensis]PST85156.1 hypothetical protein C7T94_03360 [Pedobacter yulinensis]